MERKEFLSKIGGGLAVTCVACMMAACSKDETPSTPTTPGPTGTILLTLNLNTQLLAVGDFVADQGIIVVRKATGNTAASFAAFVNSCPHQGRPLTFRKASNDFFCATHGSTFSIAGAVTVAPAANPLTARTVDVSGTTLNVR